MIDWPAVLKTVRGDDRLLQTIVEAASGEIPNLLAEIHRAAAAGESKALRLAAHTLKGSIRYFGARCVLEQVLRLETMGQSDDLNDVGHVLSVLDQSAGQLLACLAERMLAGQVATVEAQEVIP
jgi:HPt (histidine-containing phosphotransfer) domain-containing protein